MLLVINGKFVIAAMTILRHKHYRILIIDFDIFYQILITDFDISFSSSYI